MALFDSLKNLFKSQPKEQVLGYSPAELQDLFRSEAILEEPNFSTKYPRLISLKPIGIDAFYSAQLIDKHDFPRFEALLTLAGFFTEKTREFSGAEVRQCANKSGHGRLCYLVSEEFSGYTVKLVTDSVDFLGLLAKQALSVPPPWVAFEGYNPEWWGSPMQGAQGYYDENYFAPYFSELNEDQQEQYLVRYNASQKWRECLSIFYDS